MVIRDLHSIQGLLGEKGQVNLLLPIFISLVFVGFGLYFQHERIQQIKILARSIKAREFKAEVIKLRLTLGSDHHCRVNFYNNTFDANSTISKNQIVIASPTDPDVVGPTILARNQKLGALTINSIELKMEAPIYPGSRAHKATLELSAVDTLDSFKQSVLAYVVLASDGSGRVADCSLTEMASASQTYEDFVCATLYTRAIYDPTAPNGCYKIPSTP